MSTLGRLALLAAAIVVDASKQPRDAYIRGPCDIYAAAGTPCVAAHSMVRAMYAVYEGPLYTLRRTSDNTTREIIVKGDTGFVDAGMQATFCPPSTTCTVERIFDQSPNGNHLDKVIILPNNTHGWPNSGINAMRDELTVGGHAAYSAYFEGGQGTGVGTMGFRSMQANGVAKGDEPETVYAVFAGKHYNKGCCFDYGNTETDSLDDGAGTMEAIYWGSGNGGANHPGSGKGPWVMTDLENGVWAGNSTDVNTRNAPIDADFVTAMLKGRKGGFALKGGNAQSGSLKTLYDGPRPKAVQPGQSYDPMRKQGAIILGIGGDNSDFGIGTFYEGAMTANYTSDATDDEVQANIVAAGYGKGGKPEKIVLI